MSWRAFNRARSSPLSSAVCKNDSSTRRADGAQFFKRDRGRLGQEPAPTIGRFIGSHQRERPFFGLLAGTAGQPSNRMPSLTAIYVGWGRTPSSKKRPLASVVVGRSHRREKDPTAHRQLADRGDPGPIPVSCRCRRSLSDLKFVSSVVAESRSELTRGSPERWMLIRYDMPVMSVGALVMCHRRRVRTGPESKRIKLG